MHARQARLRAMLGDLPGFDKARSVAAEPGDTLQFGAIDEALDEVAWALGFPRSRGEAPPED